MVTTLRYFGHRSDRNIETAPSPDVVRGTRREPRTRVDDVNDTLENCILLGCDSLELGFVRVGFVLTRGVWPVFGKQDRSGAGGRECDPPTNCEHQHQLLACVVRRSK